MKIGRRFTAKPATWRSRGLSRVHIICLTHFLMGRHNYSHGPPFFIRIIFYEYFFDVVPRLGFLVFFYTSCVGLTATCADVNINVGDTTRHSRTKDTTLLTFVLFIAIVSGFSCFMHVYGVLVHKKYPNPYSWTHVQEERGKNCLCFTYGGQKIY